MSPKFLHATRLAFFTLVGPIASVSIVRCLAFTTALALLALGQIAAAAPKGSISPYSPSSLQQEATVAAATVASWPVWRQKLGPWQWTSIPDTDLSTVTPKPTPPGSLKARVDAWNGLAADARHSRLYSAANGGHADYSGNEVYSIDLESDRPGWKLLKAPTTEADILKSDYTKKIYNDYYRDGRPASTHTYYSLQFLASRDAVFKFGSGSLWGTGNEANWKIDAFSLENMDWQPGGTWPDVEPNSRTNVIAASVCKDTKTDDVYIAAPSAITRFDAATGRVEQLAPWIDNSTAVTARPCAVDTQRQRVVFFGDAYRPKDGGLIYDMRTRMLTRIQFRGDAVPAALRDKYDGASYDPDLDRFLLKTADRGVVLAVAPDTFVVSEQHTVGAGAVPDALNGVQNRWQRIPRLGGYAYYPRSGSGVWFLTTR